MTDIKLLHFKGWIMEIIRWLLGVAVASFIAGAGALTYLNKHVDSRIELQLEEKGVDLLESRIKDLESKEISVSFSEHLYGVENRPHQLGKNKFCALSESTTVHASQACGCVIEQNSSGWSLRINADQDFKNSLCSCKAVCFN
ncbi:hypothetical protein [Sessilibacter corallicola]|uniref:hypothetical protein n=1 Tax=Sessilibacter corallicola TaxID=2904075 RepID=UPI001E655806|nr:hypothetical protein [Sessilibacter corallicola]MCE2029553.1 hypothetical protein [Sessilibacter corallicola]